VSLADELLSRWAPILHGVELASGSKGRFEVTLDGDLLFSKATLNRHAGPGEVEALVEGRLGPPLDWRTK
jgi:predicted Rdx family selenoprotein